jgi:deoxyribodipyrimidine photo-lyase
MARKTEPPCIVWFRDDLRLSDHPALHFAASRKAPVICIYVLDERSAALQSAQWRPLGGATRWWLAQSLRALQADIEPLGGALLLRRGAAAQVITDLARETSADCVAWNDIATAPHRLVSDDVVRALNDIGVASHISYGDLLAEPSTIRNKQGNGLRVFTPFWNRLRSGGDPPAPLPPPKRLHGVTGLRSDDLAHWHLEPRHPDWAQGLRAIWTPGEAAAQARLADFLDEDIAGYATGRDRPDRDRTSHLSPHLRFGEISPRQVWHAARFAADRNPGIAGDVEKFLSELGWREFCRHLLHDVPDIATRNLQPAFDAFPWRRDQDALRAWQRGRTGYPIVDAGMRQLWQTGTMHNRIRMVVASFLVKHLLLDWRDGEAWFWDTLVDADAGNNPANWQWVAGSGADAAPYFRIFNPMLQGEKFDPDGDYVRRWVPELTHLPSKVIHKPWAATTSELTKAGVRLGQTYPEPIVDHGQARQRALAAYAKTRG